MATLMTRRPVDVAAAAAAAAEADDDAAVSVLPASSCWSWRTPCVTLAAIPDQNVHPTHAYTCTRKMSRLASGWC